MKILVVNGPNINLIGIREPEIYGSESYETLISKINTYSKEKNIELECYQSNHEGNIIDKIQEAYGLFDGIVINPAAYTHTSIAISDAIKSVGIPTVEVHISNIYEREDYRRVSYVKNACVESYSGYGFESYIMALKYFEDNINPAIK